MHSYEKVEKVLSRELAPAVGCTEPIAVALCAAYAAELLEGEEIVSMEVKASTAIIKNASGVRIPGTREKGMHMALALGAVCLRSSKGLLLLESISSQNLKRARDLVLEGRTAVVPVLQEDGLFIEVCVASKCHTARAILADRHDHLVLLQKGDQVLYQASRSKFSVAEAEVRVDELMDFARNAPLSAMECIQSAIDLNATLAKEGLQQEYGHACGLLLAPESVARLAAAGSDARMYGVPLAAMSVAGSGNQGIACVMPVVQFAKAHSKSTENTVRAVCLSVLLTIYAKRRLGRLSPLCGAVGAAGGAAGGIAYLRKADDDQIERAVIHVLGTMSGMFCDGAKASCAMKVAATAAWAAVAADLALSGRWIRAEEGIVGFGLDATLDALAEISECVRGPLDSTILGIMLEKEKRKENVDELKSSKTSGFIG